MRARTAVLALLLAISCRKAPGPPDPNYQEARRIYRRMPDSEARQVSGPDAGAPPADAGTPAPDAGTQARSAPAANSGAATDAGTTEQFLYIPGAPLPPGMQFPGAGTAGQDAGY